MARLLENQDVGGVTAALALLTSAVVDNCAKHLVKARMLLNGIRTLENAIVRRTFKRSNEALH